MKNILLAAAISAATFGLTGTATAQFNYNFSNTTQAYTPLTNATSVNNGAIWYDTSNFVIPIGFPFKLGTSTITSLTLREGNFITNSTVGLMSGIAILSATVQDRNVGKTTSASPISYTTIGTAGSRIFKLEIANAGFLDEMQYNTDNDFINYQIWFYESNNAYELRFGSSNINHFSDYFGDRILSGFMKNLDLTNGTFEKLYVLNGSASAPTIDSLPPLTLIKGLVDMPVSGTVYRFVPKNASTGIAQVTKVELGKIYPTKSLGELIVESEVATRYDILSFNGSIVKRGSIRNRKEIIDVSELTPGNYLIRLSDHNNQSDIQKFTIVN